MSYRITSSTSTLAQLLTEGRSLLTITTPSGSRYTATVYRRKDGDLAFGDIRRTMRILDAESGLTATMTTPASLPPALINDPRFSESIANALGAVVASEEPA